MGKKDSKFLSVWLYGEHLTVHSMTLYSTIILVHNSVSCCGVCICPFIRLAKKGKKQIVSQARRNTLLKVVTIIQVGVRLKLLTRKSNVTITQEK